jgi:hypothetical protein
LIAIDVVEESVFVLAGAIELGRTAKVDRPEGALMLTLTGVGVRSSVIDLELDPPAIGIVIDFENASNPGAVTCSTAEVLISPARALAGKLQTSAVPLLDVVTVAAILVRCSCPASEDA